jgi:branched-chain amino acid transport system substrate-binding protein
MKRSIALLSLLSLALAACTSGGGTAGGTIKIGFVGPLTGDAASLGVDMLNGTKLAIDEMNAKNGTKYELIAEDGRCNGADGASAAQKLINVDGVKVVIGGLCSSETLAVAPIAEAAKVVVISPGSSAPSISQAGTYIFRDYPSDALKTVATAKVFAEKGYKKVAMISENTDFCQGVRNGMKKDLPADSIVFDEVVDPGTKDVRSLLTKFKDKDFDVFYVNTNGDAQMGPIMQQFRDAGFTQPMFSHEVADSATLGKAAKDAVEGLELVTVRTAGEGTDFEKNFVAKFGKPQSSIAFAAHAYDATNLIMQTIGEKGNDGTAIRDALTALTSYKGIVGDFHFDENGDVVGVPFVLKKFHDGVTSTEKTIPLP